MSAFPMQRNRFLDDTVATASPAKLLTMLYDRLVLDLDRAEQAQRAADRQAAHTNLVHAQAILSELHSTLDVDAWEGGPALADLYGFLLTQLVKANVSGDAELTARCRGLLEPLRDAWHEAALAAVAAGPASVSATA
jgi:flagellar protein FliS